MAELSTVARPYADALFAAVSSQSSELAQWETLLQEMAALLNHDEVAQALANPRISDAQRVELFGSLIKTPLSEAARRVVDLLVENKRLALLPMIAHQFAALKDRHEGAAQVEIYSAFELTPAQVQDLIATLKPKFGATLKPHVVIDPTLIGGVRIVVGDQVLDTSVQAQLTRMREALVA